MPKEIGVKTALFADVGQLWNYEGNLNPANLNGIGANCAPNTVCLYDADKIRHRSASA